MRERETMVGLFEPSEEDEPLYRPAQAHYMLWAGKLWPDDDYVIGKHFLILSTQYICFLKKLFA